MANGRLDVIRYFQMFVLQCVSQGAAGTKLAHHQKFVVQLGESKESGQVGVMNAVLEVQNNSLLLHFQVDLGYLDLEHANTNLKRKIFWLSVSVERQLILSD